MSRKVIDLVNQLVIDSNINKNLYFRAITKKRQEFLYRINRRTKNKEDYLRFINYEMNLLKLITIRRKVSILFYL